MATNCLDVYIKLPSGRNIQFNMISTSTISNLCSEIGKKEDIDETRIQLKYHGKVLKKSHTLGLLGVQPETILKAEIIDRRSMMIQIKEADTTININTNNLQTINDLITEIKKEIALDNKTLHTVRGDAVRSSTSTVGEIGLSDGDILIVKEHSSKVVEPTAINEEELDEIKSSFDSHGRNVEVVFSFDTTGSMYSYIETVRQKLKRTCERLIADIPRIRISLIAHGDYCDQETYVLRMVDLTSNVQELVKFAEDVPRTGGGDTPECYEWVLKKAQTLDWAENSAKALVVIGDSPPHEASYTDQGINWHQELDVLVGLGVKVYGVHAGSVKESKVFYQELADRSGGCYLPLQHLDAITDMFLAVCYHESDDNQLDDFVQEIEEAGEMTSAKKEIFDQLKTSTAPKPNCSKSSVAHTKYTWWNNPSRQNNTASPSYCYDVHKDSWSSYSRCKSNRSPPTESMSASPSKRLTIRKSFRKRINKESCAVM